MPRVSPWVKHDADARSDPKMDALIAMYGYMGYGRFWALVELMRRQEGDGYRLRVDALLPGLLVRLWHVPDVEPCTGDQAAAFLEDLVDKFQLLKTDGAWLWSDSLLRRMEQYESAHGSAAERGRRGAAARWGEREGEGKQPKEGDMAPVELSPDDVGEMLRGEGIRCGQMDILAITEAIGQRGGTLDCLWWVLKQTKGKAMRSPVAYIRGLVERYGAVGKWNLAGRPSRPDPDAVPCAYCGLKNGHTTSCNRPGNTNGL